MAMPGDSISISSIAETKWQGWRLFGGNVMFMQVFVDAFLSRFDASEKPGAILYSLNSAVSAIL